MISKRLMGGAALAVAVAMPMALVAASPAAAAPKPKTATVSVLHGIPGLTVDVYADDALLIDDFTPGSLKTVKVPGGTYNLEIFPATAPDAAGTPVLQASATVANGKDYTVTANLSATGTPSMNVFVNNQAPILRPKNMREGAGRVTVRHIAAAPAVDVFINGTVAFAGLTNPNQVQGVLKKGTYQAAAGLAGAGTAGIALGPVALPVRQGWNAIVYAWGVPQSAGGAGVQVAVQYVKLMPRS